MNPKILSRKKTASMVASIQKKGMKAVFTNGCFDILHLGHVRYLQASKKLGDILIVGVNTDESIKRLKGPKRPINAEGHRSELIASLACVDAVVLFAEETPLKLIKKVQPDILVKGSDYSHGTIVGEDIVKERGGSVRRIRLQKGLSTSALIKKIKQS